MGPLQMSCITFFHFHNTNLRATKKKWYMHLHVIAINFTKRMSSDLKHRRSDYQNKIRYWNTLTWIIKSLYSPPFGHYINFVGRLTIEGPDIIWVRCTSVKEKMWSKCFSNAMLATRKYEFLVITARLTVLLLWSFETYQLKT